MLDFIIGVAGNYRRGGWAHVRAFVGLVFSNVYVRLRSYAGGPPRVECPCCGWTGYDFLALQCGGFTVPAVYCPRCKAQERHRMLHLYLTRRQPEALTQAGRVLHFAPEGHVRKLLARNPRLLIVSTDNYLPNACRFGGPAVQTDMQALGLASGAFDLLFCFHVLEHVPDDRKGLAEISRVLKPNGTAYIMVPFMMDWERTVDFDEPDYAVFDHMRGYSPRDFHERLEAFTHEKVMPGDFLTMEEIRRYRIPADSQVLYRCTPRIRQTDPEAGGIS